MRPVLGDRDLVIGLVNILRKTIHALVARPRKFVETGRTIGRLRVRFGFIDECHIDLRKPKEGKGIGEMGLTGEDGA